MILDHSPVAGWRPLLSRIMALPPQPSGNRRPPGRGKKRPSSRFSRTTLVQKSLCLRSNGQWEGTNRQGVAGGAPLPRVTQPQDFRSRPDIRNVWPIMSGLAPPESCLISRA